MKAYTDINQSKKLAEILPLESTDNVIVKFGDREGTKTVVMPKETLDIITTPFSDIRKTTPCWSLAALLNYLKNKNKFPEIKELSDGRFKLTTYIWDGKDCIQVSIGDNIVDACYEMVTKLHELNLL